MDLAPSNKAVCQELQEVKSLLTLEQLAQVCCGCLNHKPFFCHCFGLNHIFLSVISKHDDIAKLQSGHIWGHDAHLAVVPLAMSATGQLMANSLCRQYRRCTMK